MGLAAKIPALRTSECRESHGAGDSDRDRLCMGGSAAGGTGTVADEPDRWLILQPPSLNGPKRVGTLGQTKPFTVIGTV